MKLIWFNTKRVGRDTEWEFGCAWLFLLILAVVAAAVVLGIRAVI